MALQYLCVLVNWYPLEKDRWQDSRGYLRLIASAIVECSTFAINLNSSSSFQAEPDKIKKKIEGKELYYQKKKNLNTVT